MRSPRSFFPLLIRTYRFKLQPLGQPVPPQVIETPNEKPRRKNTGCHRARQAWPPEDEGCIILITYAAMGTQRRCSPSGQAKKICNPEKLGKGSRSGCRASEGRLDFWNTGSLTAFPDKAWPDIFPTTLQGPKISVRRFRKNVLPLR